MPMVNAKDSMPAEPGIYRGFNRDDATCYIGQSTNMAHRARAHRREAKAGRHVNVNLQKALRADTLSFECLERIYACEFGDRLQEVLLRREAWWMDRLRPVMNIEGPRLPALDLARIRGRLTFGLAYSPRTEGNTRLGVTDAESSEHIERHLVVAEEQFERADAASARARRAAWRVSFRQVGAAALGVATLRQVLGAEEGSVSNFMALAGLTGFVGFLVVALRDDPDVNELAQRSEKAETEMKAARVDLDAAKRRERSLAAAQMRRNLHLVAQVQDAERYGLGSAEQRQRFEAFTEGYVGAAIPEIHWLDAFRWPLREMWWSDIRKREERMPMPSDMIDDPMFEASEFSRITNRYRGS